MVGTFLGSGAIPVNEQTKCLPLWSLYLNEEEMGNKLIYTYKLYKYMKKNETEKGLGIKTFVKR